MLELWEYALVFGVAIASGTINTLVGGGAYLTLPLLTFLGLPAKVANGTNRLSVAFQALIGLSKLRQQRREDVVGAWRYALAAAVGAIPGAQFAMWLPADRFRSVMGWVLLAGLVFLFAKARDPQAAPTRERRGVGIVLSFAYGLYGGFLGAGVGAIILLTLPAAIGVTLFRALSVKVLIVLCLSVTSSVLYLYGGHVDAAFAVPLVLGNMVGGYVGARLAIRGGERFLRFAVAAVGGAMAILLILGWQP